MTETGLVERLRYLTMPDQSGRKLPHADTFAEAADALATKEAECGAYVKAIDEWVELYAKNGAPPTKDAPHGRLDWLLTTMHGIAVQRLERLRALEAECGELRRALLEAGITKATPSSQATFGGATPDPWYDPYMKSLDRISALEEQVRALREALEAECEAKDLQIEGLIGQIADLIRAKSSLQEQVRGMREALEPFARKAIKVPAKIYATSAETIAWVQGVNDTQDVVREIAKAALTTEPQAPEIKS